MDRLAAMEMFLKVAETGSFSEAARQLRTPKSRISKHVAALEAHLDARLLERTTRRLHLTEAGEAYRTWVQQIVSDVGEAEHAASDLHGEPRGRLRISVPLSFGLLHIVPILPLFLQAFPDIEADVSMSDREVDLIEEGYDMAVRIGHLADSSLIARRIGRSRMMVVASPDYLKRHGRPERPDDLREHSCLVYDRTPQPTIWRFATEGRDVAVPVKGRLVADNGELLHEASLAGLGISRLPEFFVGEHVAAGRLECLLRAFEGEPVGVHAVYPQNRQISAKVRAFVDFLAAELKPRLREGRLLP